ncbi:MAG: DUF2956 domain-containing protein [Gammaproteobacteria bacterium]|jgi:hypothetical protein|nr:DUF2956 domain-containing protein [Gammaproteobacteria bacterium]
MAKYSKKNQVSDKTKDDALKIARGTQRPGQTKEQTKLIAQGIQKGIEQYKKKQSHKARELDKKLNKASANRSLTEPESDEVSGSEIIECSKLPWVLLVLSWLGFLVYVVLLK